MHTTDGEKDEKEENEKGILVALIYIYRLPFRHYTSHFDTVLLTTSNLRMMIICIVICLAFILYVTYRLYQHFCPSPNIDPRGKYVLISGCDTGFGHTWAIELDKQGFNVLAGIYNVDNKVSLTNELSSRATVFRLDITRQEEIDAA
ncbi:unnamed protein product, partial [Rotaria sordida]